MEHATVASSSLPPSVRVRLYELFVQIEREFESLYAENVGLQERLERMERAHRAQQQQQHHQQQQQQLQHQQQQQDMVDGNQMGSGKV